MDQRSKGSAKLVVSSISIPLASSPKIRRLVIFRANEDTTLVGREKLMCRSGDSLVIVLSVLDVKSPHHLDFS